VSVEDSLARYLIIIELLTKKTKSMKYNVTLLYYSSLNVEVEANDEEEAQILAQSKGLTDKEYLEIGKNAILEGVQ
jgi:hypothetical protein